MDTDDAETGDGGASPAPEGGPAPPPGEGPSGKRGWRKILLWVGFGVIALCALIQLVPYGRSHSNPPVTGEPSWDTTRPDVRNPRHEPPRLRPTATLQSGHVDSPPDEATDDRSGAASPKCAGQSAQGHSCITYDDSQRC